MEGVLLAIVCLAPWAFGSVDAWARFGLDLGIALLAILGVILGWQTSRLRAIFCAPSLAILALVLLAVVQAAPLSASALKALDPWEANLRSELIPKTPERVVGDSGPTVPLPRPTLSQDPEASLTAASRLLAAWVLFQSVLSLKTPGLTFRRFAIALAINSALLAVVSMVQWLSWNGKVLWVRESPRPTESWYSGGPFICHNHLAAYLNIGLGMVLAIFLAAREGDPWFRARSARLWLAYVMGMILVGLIASHSRGGVLATALAGAVVFAILSRWKMRLGVGILLVPGLVLLFLMATGSLSPIQRLASIANATSDVRWEIWKTATTAWLNRPIWGMGLGTFGISLAPFTRNDFRAFAQFGESEYIHMLLEGGLVGLGLGLVGLASIGLLARKALVAASTSRDRAFILGGIFAGLALAFHWLCDFSLHVPGVGVVAVVLCGFLCRLGLDASASLRQPVASSWPRMGTLLPGLVTVVLAAMVVVHGGRQARAEAQLWGSNVPAPESFRPSAEMIEIPKDELEVMRTALEKALKLRPNWSEGHLRLGMIYLSLYKCDATEVLSDEEDDAERLKLITDPLWLNGVVHDAPAAERASTVEEVLEHDSARNYLIPAVRCFLEARRCSPVLVLSHVELANLDYLMVGADPSLRYLERGSQLVGSDWRLCELGAALAVQQDEIDHAIRYWRRSLEANPEKWTAIAEAIAVILPPDQILHEVIPPHDGQMMIQFAERIFNKVDDQPIRDLYFKLALERLPHQLAIEPAQRHCLEAYALAGLGDREQARKRMEMALILDPLQLRWRHELIAWLIDWKMLQEAQRHVAIGLQFFPSDKHLQNLRYAVVKSIAEGDTFLSKSTMTPLQQVSGAIKH